MHKHERTAHTGTSMNTHQPASTHTHTHRVRQGTWAPLSESLSGFQCLEPFYLMNAPKKMTVPCIIVYGWTLWSRQLTIYPFISFTSIKYIVSGQLPRGSVLSPGVNYARSDGTWLASIQGNDKTELCVGRIGCFMYRLMYALVVPALYYIDYCLVKCLCAAITAVAALRLFWESGSLTHN